MEPRQSSFASSSSSSIAVVESIASDRLFLRGSDVSEVRLSWPLTSCTMECEILFSSCLAAKLLTWTLLAAEASGCFCREFIVALDLPCSHRSCGSALFTRCGSALFISSLWCSSKLLGLLVVFDCLSRRAGRCRWRTVRLLHAWFSGLTSTTVHVTLLLKAASSLSGLLSDLRAQLALVRVHIVSCSGKRLAHDFDRVSRSLLWRPGRLPPRLSVAAIAALAVYFTVQTRSFWLTGQHV